jgi:Flp pilus assembly protein TadD
MNRIARATALVAVLAMPLAGCETTGASSHLTDATLTNTIGDLGVDSHGNRIASANPSLPWSNQVSLKGDQSAQLLQLGRESYHDANFGMSEKYFRKAVEIRPDNIGAWVGLAASYDELGRFDFADRAYDQIAKLHKEDARLLNNRGYSYLLRGDYAKAASYLKRAEALDPSLEEVQGNLDLLARIRDS